MIHKTFVGRSTELKQVKDWLTNTSGKMILLTGPGGVGKTSLLNKLGKEYLTSQDFVVEYFDLAEQPMAILNQALHLVDTLGRENFKLFTQKLTVLDAGSGALSSSDLEEDVLSTFIDEVASCLATQQKKLLHITDTFEIVLKYSYYGDNWLASINERLMNIPGTYFLIAGRNEFDGRNVLAETLPMLEKTFGKQNILHLPLSGFEKDEMDELFEECDSHHKIPDEMRKKLQLLTNGRPILLSLAIEWLQKNIPLPVLVEKSLEELTTLFEEQDYRAELLYDFELGLISSVRKLQTPFDRATLYMAHIDRRTDTNLLSILLGIDKDKAEENLSELLQFPFVKEFVGTNPKKCALHDEMRILVQKHAWEHLDPSHADRNRLTQKVIDKYYLPQIESLRQKKQEFLGGPHINLLLDAQARVEDQERWLLEAETVYLFSKIGEVAAFTYFDQTFYDRENSYIRDQFLLDELKRAGLNKYKVAVRNADGLRRRGQHEDAKRICNEVIVAPDLDQSDYLHAYTTLGTMYEETNPVVAEKSYVEALNLAVSIEDSNIQRILHNNLGRLYRNMSRLEDSIEHFNKALKLSRHTGNPVLISTIRNNLAWTYRLNGDLDKADVLCQLSVAENLKSGKERPLAYAYLTKADIDRDKGDLQSAEQYGRQALDMFSRQDDEDGIAQAYRTLANISRQLYRFDQALEYLEKGIQLTSSNEALPLLASMYQLYGRTIRHYANYLAGESKNSSKDVGSTKRIISFSQALDALAKSIEISQKIGNRWESARSLIEVVLIKMLESEAYDVSELHMLLDQVWDTASDLEDNFLMGYVWENRARIDQHKGKYISAGHSFGEAAYHISKRTGAESARAFTRFHNMLLARELTEKQRHALAKGMSEKIREQDYAQNSKLAALMSLCEQILDVSDNEEYPNEA